MKKQPIKPDYRCIDCANCTIDNSNLSVKTWKPILGYCVVKGHKVLLNREYCLKNYKLKKQQK